MAPLETASTVAAANEALSAALGGERGERPARVDAPRTAPRRKDVLRPLAGRLGVGIADAALAAGAVEPDFALGQGAQAWFAELGVDLDALPRGRRPLLRVCIDWTERREHLAGALGAAICSAMLGAGWAVRQPSSRALRLTPRGEAKLGALGIASSDARERQAHHANGR